jgi:hypothetical protein
MPFGNLVQTTGLTTSVSTVDALVWIKSAQSDSQTKKGSLAPAPAFHVTEL